MAVGAALCAEVVARDARQTAVTSTDSGLSIAISALDDDVFFVCVEPTSRDDQVEPSPEELMCLEAASAHLLLTPGSGAIEIVRANSDASLGQRAVIWKGEITPIDDYGAAEQPGLQLLWQAHPDEAIYGLGQRFNGLDQKGKRCAMWILDAAGSGGEQKEHSYFCTPVVYSSHGYALFATDNPEGDFDLDSGGEGICQYRRAGRQMQFYIAIGGTLRELVAKRARRQGPFRSIPDWAWGPWISRNSYEVQSEAVEVIEGMVSRGWPVAAIVQEAWKGPSESGDFNNFAQARWPDLAAYWALCTQHDIKTILWQVPVLHPSSPHYRAAALDGYFVRGPNGEVSQREHWLHGFANLDFTNPKAVAFWKDMLRDELRMGVSGFKADDGEDIKPTDVFHDGRRGWQLHNQYSMLYNKALMELLEEERVDGLLWARSGSLGIEASPALWAGDQYPRWEQLRSLVPAGLSSALSGMPFWGHDIGGYFGSPSPELYIRWLQFGAFSPMMQYHGVEPREPWCFGEQAEAAYDLLVKLRMALRPTLIDLGRAAAEFGTPIMRPMAFEFPDDPRFVREDTQYMLGPHLLVAPVMEKGATGRAVAFPAGTWQHLLHRIAFEGPETYGVPVGLVDAPVFVRQGAELELASVSAKPPIEWKREAAARTVTFQPERALLRNLRVPVFANALTRRAAVTFEADPIVADRLHVRCSPPASTRADIDVALACRGTHCSFALPVSADIELIGLQQLFVIEYVGDDSASEVVLSGTVRWGQPIALEVEQPSSILVPGGEQVITARFANRSYDPLSIEVVAQCDDGVTISEPQRVLQLAPHAECALSWTCSFADSNTAGAARVRLEARCADKPFARHDCWFAPQWRWVLAGPFRSIPRAAHHVAFGPEWAWSPNAVFQVGDERSYWQQLRQTSAPPGAGIDFAEVFGPVQHAAAYAMTRFHAEYAQEAEFHFGSDDTLTVWLNGLQVYSVETYRAARPDQERFVAHLQQGANTLLVKVAQDQGDWQMYAYLSGTNGRPTCGVDQAFDDFENYAPERTISTPELIILESPRWQLAGPLKPGTPADQGLAARAEGEPWPPGGAREWLSYQTDVRNGGTLDFNRAFGYQSDAVAYATTTLCVDRDTPAELVCGSDDGLTLWLNGERLIHAPQPRVFAYDAHRIRTVLVAGENRVLARVSQGIGEWKFRAVFWDVTEVPHRALQFPRRAGAE